MTTRETWAEAKLHYRFSDPTLLEQAFTHRSASKCNNERLEFLGDAFLSFVVGQRLYERNPTYPEGDLSRARASLVRGTTLAQVARELGFDQHVILGRGELRTGAAQRSAILADAFEAVLGAVVVDGGDDAARQLVDRLFGDRLAHLPSPDELKDPKTKLQEWLQGRGRPLPEYTVDSVRGRDHERVYAIFCDVADANVGDGRHRTHGEARSRRVAEQKAAAAMLTELKQHAV